MASLCACDKCGKEVDFKTRCFTSVAYKEDGKNHADTYDLCVECSTKLHTLVKHFVKKEEIKLNELPEIDFSLYGDLAKDVYKKYTGSEIEETNHDTEMISIPVEQYDSLNRMIAHYSDESERFKKCIDTIAESNKNFIDETTKISKAILEAKLGIPLVEAMVNLTSDFLKRGEDKNE